MMFTVTGIFSSTSSIPSSIPSSTAQCRSQKLETSDDIVDDTKEVNNSTSSNSSLTAVQQPVDKAATLVATPVSLSRDSSENIEGSSKSVHGIVASLIRAAEETRFQTPDKPNSLNVSNKKFQQEQPSITTTTTTASARQEIGTQTSPYSLSRSSSFDWINESSIEDQYSEELVTASTESPGTPEDPEYSLLNRITEPSRITDREIQGMLRKNMEARNSLLEEKKTQSSEDIDESIAMLLEYAEDLNIVSNRVLHYPVISENLTKHANDIRNNDSVLSREISSDISRNRMPSTNNQNEFFRHFSSSTGNNNGSGSGTISLATQHTYVGKGNSQGSMNGSIYDNVSHGIKQTAALQASLLANVNATAITTSNISLQLSGKDNNNAANSAPISTKLSHGTILSHDPKIPDNSASPDDNAISQRDISVSSGLADSESSPMTPGAPAAIGFHHSSKCRKQQPNKTRSQLAQIEIDSSFEMDMDGKEVRPPPPPSPRLDTEKKTLSVVLASDLFAFSAGRVPKRAESCEELDVDFTEQTSDELYALKKQKVEEEAVECVRWLRDAGFPQYARLYEEQRFPIDIRSVKRDHEFLDDDSLRALFRRLNALNRCAIMKVENVVLRKHPERFDINPLEPDIDDDMTVINYDDDDDDQVAISNKWKYQRNSQTWSRIVQGDDTAVTFSDTGDNIWRSCEEAVSSAELDEALRMSFGYGQNPRRQPDGASCFSDVVYDRKNQHDVTTNPVIARNDRNCPAVSSSSSTMATVNLQRSQSERLKERARALIKRMDIRSSSRRRRQRDSSVADSEFRMASRVSHSSLSSATTSSSLSKAVSNVAGRDLVIGDPVLVSHFSASPRTMRMFPDGLSSILSSQAVTPQMLNQFRRRTAATAADHHPSDGVTFAVLQPTMQQQQQQRQQQQQPQQQQQHQQIISDCETGSPQYSCFSSPSSRFRTRFLGASNRRMGMVLDSTGSSVTSSHQRQELLCRNKARDMSFDRALVRELSQHDHKTRIYDRVAQDLCSDNTDYASPRCGPVNLEATACYDRRSRIAHYERASSSEHCCANSTTFSSLIRNGVQFSGDVLSDNSLKSDELRSLPKQNLDRDRDLAPAQLYARSRLVVNADGYYEHIPSNDIHDTSFELEAFSSNDSVTGSVAGAGTSGATVSVTTCHRAISPESSSSNTSISNHASRLKAEVDGRGGKRLGCGSSSSLFNTGRGMSAQRSHSSLESSGNDDELIARQQKSGSGERRDSGVGSSLSRSPSGPTTQRLRNSLLFTTLHHPEMKSKHLSPSSLDVCSTDYSETFIGDADLAHCVDALSVGEMQQIRKLAFLKLSVLIETYAGSGIRIGIAADNNGSGRVSKSWAVHKFIRRMRNNDTVNGSSKSSGTELSTFGLPLAIIQSRSGFALPRFILEMMHFLRIVAPDTVGIFRKSGVRSRITELRMLCDVAPEAEVFSDGKLDPSQVHDVADLLKQYFRELPEPLMTAKYSETFARIFIHIPMEMRIEALQHAVLLLPDEHREALQTLLYFLHDIAKHSATNSMTPQNLAVCFAPSLFQLCGSRLSNISPTRRHKTIGAAGLPTEREIKESRAAQECLVQMIEHCTKVFIVPTSPGLERDEGSKYCKGTEPDAPFLTELGLSQDGNYKTYLLQKARELLKGHRDRWKGWIVEGTVDGVEISTKKSTDGHPLRFFRVWVDIEAPPREILIRIVRERNVWDLQIINWRTVAVLNAENCDVFQYVINDTPSHPTRDATVVRLWHKDLKELRGGCVLVERSVHSSETQMLGGISIAVLSSQFLVEPIAGRSRVTYITRTDLRGRSNIWYSKVYGQLIARQLSRLRDSFKQFTHVDDGPETKV
ncbi:RhoGAP domain family protein [Brugia pahangi]